MRTPSLTSAFRTCLMMSRNSTPSSTSWRKSQCVGALSTSRPSSQNARMRLQNSSNSVIQDGWKGLTVQFCRMYSAITSATDRYSATSVYLITTCTDLKHIRNAIILHFATSSLSAYHNKTKSPELGPHIALEFFSYFTESTDHFFSEFFYFVNSCSFVWTVCSIQVIFIIIFLLFPSFSILVIFKRASFW